MNYNKNWDLSTIPDDAFASERGRRNQAKGGHLPKPAIFKQCSGTFEGLPCQMVRTARERRKPCPSCGIREDSRKRT